MRKIEAERPTGRGAFLRIATVGVAILCWAASSSPAFAAAGLKFQRKGALRVSSGDVRTLSPSACVPASIACNGTVAGALTTDDCPYGDGTFYDDPGADFFTRLHPERAKNRALHQLQAMGYQVTLDRVG